MKPTDLIVGAAVNALTFGTAFAWGFFGWLAALAVSFAAIVAIAAAGRCR